MQHAEMCFCVLFISCNATHYLFRLSYSLLIWAIRVSFSLLPFLAIRPSSPTFPSSFSYIPTYLYPLPQVLLASFANDFKAFYFCELTHLQSLQQLARLFVLLLSAFILGLPFYISSYFPRTFYAQAFEASFSMISWIVFVQVLRLQSLRLPIFKTQDWPETTFPCVHH